MTKTPAEIAANLSTVQSRRLVNLLTVQGGQPNLRTARVLKAAGLVVIREEWSASGGTLYDWRAKLTDLGRAVVAELGARR